MIVCGDYKEKYSAVSKLYVEETIQKSSIDIERYDRAKGREALYNEEWKRNPVNINEIVDRFIPSSKPHSAYSQSGCKYIFEGDRYIVKCDKVGGYLRIFDKQLKMYCDINGIPSRSNNKTHFKIKKREEM